MKNTCFVLLLLSLNGVILDAQPPDYSARLELLQEQLVKLSGLHDSIFNICEYPVNGKLFYTRGNKYIHPFFIDNDWKSGMIWSSDKVYKMNMVKYDISNDYLVLLYYMDSFAFPVYLNKESVKEFMITGHLFRYMNDFANSSEEGLKPGYYEVIYDGITKVCVRWEKLENLNNGASDPVYSQRVYSFLKMKGKYVRIIGRKSLIKALIDHEKEIKIYMKKNNLRFSGNNFEILGKVLEYYDNL